MAESGKNIPAIIVEKIEALAKLRREILALPPGRALDAVIGEDEALPLVRSFSEQDLYLLISETGREDSLDLLAMASADQLDYILDMDSWIKDRFDRKSAGDWLELFHRADPPRFMQWVFREKDNEQRRAMMELILKTSVDTVIREHDQDPSELGDDFFTFDDVFYIRLKPGFAAEKKEDDFASKFLNGLKDFDHLLFQSVIFSHTAVIPAETEEELLRLRNVRLAEKGFLPHEEAVGLYQPISGDGLKHAGKKRLLAGGDSRPHMRLPVCMDEWRRRDDLFTETLKSVESDSASMEIQLEFAGLCSRLISADQTAVTHRTVLAAVVKKASGYLSMGLERIMEREAAGDSPAERKKCCVRAITGHTLADIFRFGYAPVVRLRTRVAEWMAKSRFLALGFGITFWDEEWAGTLGGLLLDRPLFFAKGENGDLYRDFEKSSEVREGEAAIEGMSGMDDLLGGLGITVERLSDESELNTFITYKNLILTFWAKHAAKAEFGEDGDGGSCRGVEPLTDLEMRSFFPWLFQKNQGGGESGGKINDSAREAFLKVIAKEAGVDAYDLGKRLGRVFESLFSEMEAEYGPLDHEHADYRYVKHFLTMQKP